MAIHCGRTSAITAGVKSAVLLTPVCASVAMARTNQARNRARPRAGRRPAVFGLRIVSSSVGGVTATFPGPVSRAVGARSPGSLRRLVQRDRQVADPRPGGTEDHVGHRGAHAYARRPSIAASTAASAVVVSA